MVRREQKYILLSYCGVSQVLEHNAQNDRLKFCIYEVCTRFENVEKPGLFDIVQIKKS
jgi:hypothetical protein